MQHFSSVDISMLYIHIATWSNQKLNFFQLFLSNLSSQKTLKKLLLYPLEFFYMVAESAIILSLFKMDVKFGQQNLPKKNAFCVLPEIFIVKKILML